MAEAVVEERAAVPKRYFCHMCNVEIDIPNTEFTCPLCAGGFVEELPPRPTTPSTSANNGTAGAGGGGARSTQGGTSSMFDLRDLQRGNFNDLEAIRGEIATLLMSRNGENVEISLDPGHGRGGNLAAPGGHLLTQSPSAGGGVVGGGVGRTAGGRMRVATLDSLDQILMDFLNSLSGGDPIGAAGNPYNSQMFFMGNPGDYAWGREGIDTIVTQLLNQMETSGPPPLSKEKINEISTVPVSNEEIERKLQCSVCWEDFQLDEMVRKLPCSHMYHENCIVPWLKLHGTCPICRKSLDENAEDGENTDAEERSADVEMNDVSSYNDGSSEGGGGGVGGASNSSASSQQQQQQRSQTRQSIHDNNRPNNVFNFEDDRNLPLD